MRNIRSIAVFCGSNMGASSVYAEQAEALGATLVENGVTLVYGGTHKGLMGVLADAVLSRGGRAHGVITERLQAKGHIHPNLTDSEVVPTMRTRKERMAELADAFIALPGGIGTMEEFMEAWTLNQLGELDKPAGLLNINGFFEPFMAFIDQMIKEAFLPPSHRQSMVLESDPQQLLDSLRNFQRVTVPKWL
jgi:uncharacterized protein (TIGR00730 family)